jgi:hypothetical protein
MSSLTIDSILNDIRGSESGAEETTEKRASAEQSTFSENEIESMAELLKKAEYVPETKDVEAETEKVAEMSLLFSAAFDTLADAPKYDTLRKEAQARGYEESAIDDFIEKKASMNFLKNLSKKQVMMGLGMGMTTAGAGAAGAAGGYQYGTEKQKEKTKEVAQGAFRAGRMFQHQRHQGRLSQIRQRIAERLQNIKQG